MPRITGPNFDVEERRDGVAVVRVWRRPDLTREQGAACAEQIVEQMRRLSASARYCVFDLREATTTWGPVTNRSIGEMLAVWETAGKNIYVLPADEAIQRLLLRELKQSRAPRFSKLVTDRDELGELLTLSDLPRRV